MFISLRAYQILQLKGGNLVIEYNKDWSVLSNLKYLNSTNVSLRIYMPHFS
jgi:hypothetical protein